jgi:carboxylesterase
MPQEMNSADEPPPQSAVSFQSGVNVSDFYFDGAGVSALLVHGLTGTPYEMRYLGERLASAGVRVRGIRLAGHAGAPEELGAATHENWYESVVQGFEELRRYGDPNVVIGLSAGAVLSARLASDQREAVAGLVMLAPAFFLPRPVTAVLKLVAMVGTPLKNLYLYNSADSDIHDAGARRVHPTVRLMPLTAPISLLELSAIVRPMLPRITQPALIMHARNDHTCPMQKNVGYLMRNLGSRQKRALELEDSYHVITVDSEKDRVANEVVNFVAQFRIEAVAARAAAAQ